MDLQTTLATLQAAGKEQTRKTYRRHGVTGDQYGVLTGDMQKIQKKIKINHALARELWVTGNYDARILATKIADPKQADDALVDAWGADLDNYAITDAFYTFVAATPLAQAKMRQWMPSENEWLGDSGWSILAILALGDPKLTDEELIGYLEVIKREIHTRKNRVRYAMNNAVIAIGGRNDTLKLHAITAAGVIGRVEVDHGDTHCKTPEAVAYIEKMWAHKAQRKQG
jgi:3-methyladenine DNA glycosylase AlkD